MSDHRCLCPCHEGGFADRIRADGVSVFDPIEAVIACDACRKSHCRALLEATIWDDSAQAGAHTPVLPPDIVKLNGGRHEYDNGEFRAPPKPKWNGEDGG